MVKSRGTAQRKKVSQEIVDLVTPELGTVDLGELRAVVAAANGMSDDTKVEVGALVAGVGETYEFRRILLRG